MSITSKKTSIRVHCFARSMQSNGGFTLVELLVVCVIIGIVAALALPAVYEFRQKTRISRAAAEIRGLEKDIIAFASEKGSYPTDADAPGMEELKNLKDPWGNNYVYSIIPTREFVGTPINTDFDLYSKGPDGTSTVLSTQLGDGADDIIRGGDGSFVGVALKYP